MSRDDAPNKIFVCYIEDGFERIEIDKVFFDREKASEYCAKSENLYFKEVDVDYCGCESDEPYCSRECWDNTPTEFMKWFADYIHNATLDDLKREPVAWEDRMAYLRNKFEGANGPR